MFFLCYDGPKIQAEEPLLAFLQCGLGGKERPLSILWKLFMFYFFISNV